MHIGRRSRDAREDQMEQMTRTKAIKTYFEQDGGRKIKMDEMTVLSKEERDELGRMCAAELGVEIIDAV